MNEKSSITTLKGKTVLVTGASRGIGRGIAIGFGSLGCNVVINYLNSEEKALEVRDEINKLGGKAIIVRADVRNEEQVKKMVKFIEAEFGGVDILINNVGEYRRKDFLQLDREEIQDMFEINFLTTFNVTKEVLPHMIAKKWGRIINIASISGIRGSSRAPHYAAAKAAVIGLTKSLARIYGKYNITVNAIAPGLVDTDLLHKWFSDKEIEKYITENPMRRIANINDVAKVAVMLALADYVNGQVVVVSGGNL